MGSASFTDKSRPILVLGAGGHGKVLVDTLQACGADIIGITDPDSSRHGGDLLGVKILGGDELVAGYEPAKVLLVNGLGYNKENPLREKVFRAFRARGYRFATVVHPSATISSHAKLAEGAQVLMGATIQAGASIGANSVVNTRASVDHDCQIGAHVHLAPGVTLSGTVTVGDGVHIGTGAAVIQGVEIGAGAFVAAGSVVTADVPKAATVMGVPARPRSSS